MLYIGDKILSGSAKVRDIRRYGLFLASMRGKQDGV
jgi:hypothetical protein